MGRGGSAWALDQIARVERRSTFKQLCIRKGLFVFEEHMDLLVCLLRPILKEVADRAFAYNSESGYLDVVSWILKR